MGRDPQGSQDGSALRRGASLGSDGPRRRLGTQGRETALPQLRRARPVHQPDRQRRPRQPARHQIRADRERGERRRRRVLPEPRPRDRIPLARARRLCDGVRKRGDEQLRLGARPHEARAHPHVQSGPLDRAGGQRRPGAPRPERRLARLAGHEVPVLHRAVDALGVRRKFKDAKAANFSMELQKHRAGLGRRQYRAGGRVLEGRHDPQAGRVPATGAGEPTSALVDELPDGKLPEGVENLREEEVEDTRSAAT
jgi:hypothetical protein